MKRFKLSTIVLSACLALSALAGCSQGSAPAAGTMPDRATPHESEGVASEISAIIYEAEDPEDAAAEAPADEDSFSGNYTDSVDGEYADPDADRQIYANAFVSAFAEQNISEMDTENLTVEEYLDFVRIYLKTHATDLISYEPKGEMLFETFTPASAHEVIKVFFGFFTSDVFGSGLEAPSEAHGDQPAGPFYEDGRFWYEACDTEDSNRFAIVDSYTVNEDGTMTLGFTVYEAGPNDSLYECYRLSPEEAAADSTINIVTNGTATVRINQSGEYSLIYYKADI
ncbi:MAG: hypothetical protein E7383_11425 [Ruminococcaceae bacterium]|nr:hypothetical protein [Oscillospiraceae bacterium]